MSVLLAVQGGLIILGAVLVAVGAGSILPLDNLVGADAGVAAIVLGAAFIFALRTPNRAWVNLAIMYNALTLVIGVVRWVSYGAQLTPTAMAVSLLFLVAFLVCYPRGHALEASPA